jgi:hypothetical protein
MTNAQKRSKLAAEEANMQNETTTTIIALMAFFVDMDPDR